MTLTDPNIYKRCRLRTDSTQEKWAEKLGISVESVKRYEAGLITPSMWVVRRMIEESGYDALALQHVYQVTEDLAVLPAVQTDMPLERATIRVINCVADFFESNRDKQLLKIAEDGTIDETEAPLFKEILVNLREMAAAYYGLKFSTKKEDSHEL